VSTKSPPARSPLQARRDAVAELGRAFKGANAAVRRLRGREARHPGGLSDAQYGLLFSLCGQEAMSAGELAHAADVSPAAATEMLDALASAGLVERQRSDHDRRVVLTSLTEQGLALVQERRARFEPRWRAALGQFSDKELRAGAAILNRIRDMFDEVADEEGRR